MRSGVACLVLPTAILCCFTLACAAMDVEINRFEETVMRSPGDACEVQFYRGSTILERECDLIARVRIGDFGFSTDCGSDRIRREVRRIACEIGGDAAELKAVSNSLSTCIESDADLDRCDPGRVPDGERRVAFGVSDSGGSPPSDDEGDLLAIGTRVD